MKCQSDFWFFDERTSQFLTALTLPVKNEYSTGLVMKKNKTELGFVSEVIMPFCDVKYLALVK